MSTNTPRSKSSGRKVHYCPVATSMIDGFPGKCCISVYPMLHCETHQSYCLRHRSTVMKSTCECVTCKAESKRRYVTIISTHLGKLLSVTANGSRKQEENKERDKVGIRNKVNSCRRSNRLQKQEEREKKSNARGGTQVGRIEKTQKQERGDGRTSGKGGKEKNRRTRNTKLEAPRLATSTTVKHGADSPLDPINVRMSREISPRFPRSMVWIMNRAE